jgi:glycosyltransferase involved in cell wall biosynthesis
VFGSAIDRDVNPFVTEQHKLLEVAGVLDAVEFCGVVGDLRAHLPGLDLMLITSRRESFSRVAAECMLAGLPLIAPDIPGLNETTENGRFSIPYRVADPSSAAEALSPPCSVVVGV